jgi:HK97 family phage prohead protease
METHEERIAAYEAEIRTKYTQKERDEMAGTEAMADGSYPIKDADDLAKAISAVGRGGADHDAIRKHVMARAAALGLSKEIPENWNADGSLKQENAARTRRRKERHRAIPLDREVRHFVATGLEVRAQGDSDEITITGKPIMYETPYTVRDAFGEFEERMMPGCASDLLERGTDCRFLLNHDGLPMARTTAGTLRLWDTPEALNFEAKLDARQQLASDFAIAVERGDITQMSVGMIVGRDEWGVAEGRETRDVHALDDLLDVSGVTYPASPTTSIEIARRMALEVPVESQARVRRLEVDLRSGNVSAQEIAEGLAVFQGHEERAGKVLSGANKDKVATAIGALMAVHEASGGDAQDFVKTPPEPVVSTEDGASLSNEAQSDPGESMRSAPKTADERREQMLSFGDKESAVYEALVARFETNNPWCGPCDIWVCDLSEDWVVFESWGEPRGLWKIGYSLDDQGVATLDGDPTAVLLQKQYVPSASSSRSNASVSALRLQLDARKRRRIAA